jgi:hypothetical protein
MSVAFFASRAIYTIDTIDLEDWVGCRYSSALLGSRDCKGIYIQGLEIYTRHDLQLENASIVSVGNNSKTIIFITIPKVETNNYYNKIYISSPLS